jgi:threonine dehydrogenase-like Zn-dependent dehydrogenase
VRKRPHLYEVLGPEAVRELTGGRGADAVIDAVGMEAHGAPGAKLAHTLVGSVPDAIARKVMQTAGIDRQVIFRPEGA